MTENPVLPASFKSLLSQINNVDIISFDIFDTAIFRAVRKPSDVFKIIEKTSCTPNFYENRRLAARLERKEKREQGVNEITLDQIYSRLSKIDTSLCQDKIQQLKTAEIEWELSLCRRNEEIGSFYKYLKQIGKKVYFTSDMYLPKEVIEKILHKNGYTDYDVLLISAQDGLTKKEKTRYASFPDKNRILHIGDNQKSDFINAQESGIQSFWYQKKNPFLFDRLVKKLAIEKDIFFNLWQALISNYDYPSYWHAVGYQYVGPLLVSFSMYLQEHVNPNEKLCFLARDGMIMQKAFKAYVENSNKDLYLLCSRALTSSGDFKEIYTKYLEHLGLSGSSFAVVDVGRKGSIQNKLADLLPDSKITGYYVDLRVNAPDKKGFFTKTPKKYNKFLDFLDFLFIAPTSLAIGIKEENQTFDALYLEKNADEEVRQKIAAEIHAGAEKFALDVRDFSNLLSLPNRFRLLDCLNSFMNITKNDKKYFSGVKIPFGLKNEKSRYIIAPNWTFKTKVSRPIEYLKLFNKRMIKKVF